MAFFLRLYLNFKRITETFIVMLIYLDQAREEIKRKCRSAGREPGAADLYAAVMEGAVERGLEG